MLLEFRIIVGIGLEALQGRARCGSSGNCECADCATAHQARQALAAQRAVAPARCPRGLDLHRGFEVCERAVVVAGEVAERYEDRDAFAQLGPVDSSSAAAATAA